MNIIGLSAFYHDSACCLLSDGKLVAAASEERFTRVKYDPRLPVNAFRFCLEMVDLDITQIDAIAWYENPTAKLARQLWCGPPRQGDHHPGRMDPHQPEIGIRQQLGFEGPILYFDHHLSHGAASYYFSGFEDAAILTADGVGEWCTTSYGRASGNDLELFEEVHFPHSLGLLYAAITAWLGFKVNDGEYKVMGLAPYGKPVLADKLRQLICMKPGGGFQLDMQYFDFINGSSMFSPKLCDLLGQAPRKAESELSSLHFDVARSLQLVLEEVLLEKVRWLATQVDSPNLCMAGGVALNCVANGRIKREGPFSHVFIQPAAGDAGSCLGAAALAWRQLQGRRPDPAPMQHALLGPSWSSDQIARLINETGLKAQDYRGRRDQLNQAVVDRLVQNEVVGWFQGAMEFGPRALGSRSILANPLDPNIRDRLNRVVKKRESFRPFAPSVLAEQASAHFQLDHASPFMLEICQVISALDLPGITHVDGSARPQTVHREQSPEYWALIQAFFQRTGCPMLVNTSFNVRSEPIVCTPADALFCFSNSHLDCLILEDFLIERTMLPPNHEVLFAAWRTRPRSPFGSRKSVISENLYSFV